MGAPLSRPVSTASLATETLMGSGHSSLSHTVPGGPQRARAQVHPGQSIGRYVIREPLGAGGMGEVFAAHDTELDRDVALKLINTRRVKSDAATRREHERLRLEAQSLARLSHPNVVQVYEVGRHGQRTYLAMELVEGPTLADWQSRGSGQALVELAELVEVFAQAARGLAAAHAVGLVHRDFKPNNVLIGRDGRVRVVDFGLAAPASTIDEAASTIGDDSDDGETPRSASVGGPGTLPYMAPEQAFCGTGGAAADQFSFCVALFEAVYGARPFPARGVMELLCKLDTCTIEYPAEHRRVPRWLRRLLERGLSRHPGDRYESMVALIADLTRDRRRVWRRAGFAALVSALTAATVLALAPAPAPNLRGVSSSEPSLAGVWDSEHRSALARAFAEVEAPWASASESAVVSGLDHWSQRWLAAARAAERLADTHARRALTSCLDGQRAQAQVTIDALTGVTDPALLEGAVAAVDALPEPSRCSARAQSAVSGDIDPEQLVPELRRLADAAAQRSLGNFELASASAAASLREAEAHDWTQVQLAALRQHGLAELEAGRRVAGLADLERARSLAIRSGDSLSVAELSVELAWAGRKLDNPALRRDRIELARAHVDALAGERGHADPGASSRHTQLLAARVDLSAALDRLTSADDGALDEAETLLVDSLAALDALDARDTNLALEHLHALAGVRDRARLFEQAEQDYRRALAEAERVRGPDHPTNARLWHDAGALAHERGELELARERLTRARDIRRAALRTDHPELARSELDLAELEYVSHDYAAAREHAELALRSFELATGDRDALPEALRMLGLLEAREGKWVAAAAYYERALPLMTQPGLQRALLELELGKSLVALGEHERALSLLDGSLPIVTEYLGPERCAQLIPSYRRHIEVAKTLGDTDAAAASRASALACTTDSEARAALELELR